MGGEREECWMVIVIVIVIVIGRRGRYGIERGERRSV